MYGFDETTVAGPNFIPAGINENVTLASVSVDEREDKSGLVLKFKFVDDEGRTFNYNEFPVNEKDAPARAKMFKMTVQKLIEEDQRNQGERIKHILNTFQEIPKIKADSWEDFLQQLDEILKGIDFALTPVRIKTVYNKRNFITFPKRPIRPFIQRMTDSNTLEITKYDTVTPYEISKADTGTKTGFVVSGEIPEDLTDYHSQGISAFDDVPQAEIVEEEVF